jgi:hypothetical protein
MSNAFEYRPKFVDIRVKKPDAEAPFYGQEGGDWPACDYVGCERVGVHRAPKSRERAGEYWRFCQSHAAAYNRRWDYFAGMSDTELAAYQQREETGHRPTWSFRSGRLDRFSGALRGRGRRSDPFGFFTHDESAPAAPRRRLTRLQSLALEALSLDERADAPAIRTRYAELVKRWHPDSNGGDRSAEQSLQRVIKAYQTLKAAGLV